MVLHIEFRVSWVVSFLAVTRTSLEGQMACWLALITLGGRVMLSPWLVEGLGRETRARMATRARNSIFESCIVLTNSLDTGELASYLYPPSTPLHSTSTYQYLSSCLRDACGE